MAERALATFRFYAALNDFLPRQRRQRDFPMRCARAATAKHMIEALGVPHTEVGLLVVNGEVSEMGRLLQDGDRVAVYPPLCRLLPPAPLARPPRFLADAHLGGLAHMLRMMGFDTLYDNRFHDDAIVRLAARDGRIVLTRDRELLKRRAIEAGCYVHALKSQDQLREVVERFDLARDARPFSLCIHCNAPLHPVAKERVVDRLPPRVRAGQERFSTCDLCHRVYWEGTHWRNMRHVLDGLVAPGAQNPNARAP